MQSSEANLEGADLKGANLIGSNLSGAGLAEADFSGALLSGAGLAGADLAGAILGGASLEGANLQEADLSGAKGLSQRQIEEAIGSTTTPLPESVRTPETWSKSGQEQRGILEERWKRVVEGNEKT